METTIAAISTAMSASGIGIIRISGENAMDVISRIYRSKGGKKKIKEVPTHTIHYGYIYDGEELIDEVLVMIMHAPRTFTGEDTVEIDCHGGVYAMQRVLDTVLKNGAEIAEPGEFTKRAFLNGRMDLSQAEAVMDVIQAKNEYALRSSMDQLRGSVQKAIRDIREKLIYHIAYIESALDDPEHISLDGYPVELGEKVDNLLKIAGDLLKSSQNGRVLREGIRTVIVGKPNAGKSSLMNVLVGSNRAIVTDMAGTTRDILEEEIQLKGLNLNIVDTAGIRKTDDPVEKIGVERAKKAMLDADLILYVVDSSADLDENDEEIISFLQDQNAIILLNKADLPSALTVEKMQERLQKPTVSISAREETGMDELSDLIEHMFLSGEISFNDQVYLTNMRHQAAMEQVQTSLMKVKESISLGMPEDFFSIDLMDAYEALGSIIGESVGEDLVNEIFSKFCMGK